MPIHPDRRSIALLLATAFTVPALLCGCRQEEPTRYRRIPKGAGFIAFVGAAEHDPLWPILRAGAERFERNQGLIEVRYVAPAVDSPDQQVALIRSLVGPSLRGLCVQVIDPAALEPVFDLARQNGARIVTMIRRTEYPYIDGHVGYDETAVGSALAEATIQYLRRQGAIAILHDAGGDRALRDRYSAFTEAMKPAIGIERWAEIECGGNPVEVRRTMASFAARYPRLSAWVSIAPWPIMELSPRAVTTAASSPLPPGCELITCGAEPWVWPFIESGICPLVVGFSYADAGLKALQFCQAATESSTIGGREYMIPIRIVTRGNLDEYRRDWAVWSEPATAAGRRQ
ncbi:MAG: sugar ABC transporter substrate-binding protein [Phycisphaerae bacterium]